MITAFDYGPRGRIRLELTGEIRQRHGRCADLPENVQDALQLLAHAMIQLAPRAKRNDGALSIGDFVFLFIESPSRPMNCYSLNNLLGTGYSVMNMDKNTADGSYSTEFFSVKQMTLADPFLDAAEKDALANGRNG